MSWVDLNAVFLWGALGWVLMIPILLWGLFITVVVLSLAWNVPYSILGVVLPHPDREFAKNGMQLLLIIGGIFIAIPFVPLQLWSLEDVLVFWSVGGACLALAGVIFVGWRARGGFRETIDSSAARNKLEIGGSSGNGTIVTVFSARGGTGKTTIAINLAVTLARETGQRVALVDSDTRFGDVAILLDIDTRCSISDLAIPEEEITRDMLRKCMYSHNTGVAVLPAPVGPTEWRKVNADHVGVVVTLLRQAHDYIILDTPGTFNDIVVRTLEMATTVVLVCNSDDKTLEDTRQAIDYLRSSNLWDKTKLVVNSQNEGSGREAQEVASALGHQVLYSIPYDRNVSHFEQLGQPLMVSHPDSEAAQSIVRLAQLLQKRASSSSRCRQLEQ
jgi:MinD-like ATPase involved in chromosome partitioning or flagellar assembly